MTLNNLPSWTTWTATRWYGIAGPETDNGGGSKLITASAFAMEDDASMPGTPIDAATSTFTDGPAGQQAHPFGTPPDDHVASTQWGQASVAALDPFRRRWSSTECCFAGWLRLVLGGDASGQFDETDGAAIGGSSFYSRLDASPVPMAGTPRRASWPRFAFSASRRQTCPTSSPSTTSSSSNGYSTTTASSTRRPRPSRADPTPRWRVDRPIRAHEDGRGTRRPASKSLAVNAEFAEP